MAQMGMHIYKRKDGRFEGRLIEGRKADGKLKYRSVYGHSYAEVEQRLACLRTMDTFQSLHAMDTVGDLLTEWLCAISPRVKPSTLSNYRMKVEKHLIPAFGTIRHDALHVRQVQAFIEQKIAEGLSPRYVSDIVVILKSAYKYASRTYQLPNPLVHVILPKKKKTEIHILDARQQKRLQMYLQSKQNRTSMGIMLTLYTGLRIGELCALRWEDIDFAKRTLTINHTMQRIQHEDGLHKTQLTITDPKSASSKRTIPLAACLIPLLQQFMTKGSDFVLSGNEKPIEPRTMQYRFAAILKKANLPSVHFHALRHMFATNCIALGFDVKSLSEILGHSSVEITLNRYVHSSMEQKRHYMERLSMAV